MRGTGTAGDPFVIMTAEDLYAMETAGGQGKYCQLGADIDLNGTPWAEHFQPIPLNCSSFDGCGHKIRNVYSVSGDSIVYAFDVMVSGDINISDVFLENIVLTGTSVNLFGSSAEVSAEIKMYRCAVSMVTSRISRDSWHDYTNCILHGDGITVSSELCTYALEGHYSSHFHVIKGGTFVRSQLMLNNKYRGGADSSETYTALLSGTAMSDSWLSGSLSTDNSGDRGQRFFFSDEGCSTSNCYVAVDAVNFGNMFWSANNITKGFYDGELLGSGQLIPRVGSLGNFDRLTTAQCKDPVYLRSIGFSCGGGEG